MEKLQITAEQLLAGLLLKYGKASFTDINVFAEDIENKFGISIGTYAIDFRNITNYILMTGNNFYPLDFEGAKEELEKHCNYFILKYLEEVNIEDITLRKINTMGAIPDYCVANVMCDAQEKALERLYDANLVISVWNTDIPHEDYQEVQLTSLGQKKIFELEYGKEITEFAQLLEIEGYNVSLLSEFLLRQDFRLGVYEILNIDNFILFCNTYDRPIQGEKKDTDPKKVFPK